MNPYIVDILAQPASLREAVQNFFPDRLNPLVDQLQDGIFDRIILSGMGSSYNAAYPTFVRLTNSVVPVSLINGSELLHTLTALAGPRTLLWLNSQSGRSAELVHLLQKFGPLPPAAMLACVNELASPVAETVDICFPIHAGKEATVSTKTYLNMLAINLLVAEYLMGGNLSVLKSEILAAADAMESYLATWDTEVTEMGKLFDENPDVTILGRGTSLAAVWNGSLIMKEAAKSAIEGMHAADFRHGPLELADPEFSALIFAGSPETSSLNHRLALEIIDYGGHVFWIDHSPDPDLITLLIPKTSDRTRPFVEILPLQMLTIVMSRLKKIEPGHFRNVGKITERE
jgi:glucosamine--fructose-6-phosphate aminotransferase (isomerizing)